ncbi:MULTISPECIES: hypothetical protein [Aerosakkonema]|uniref:hypothetical protein n=1 Tax=Aerosakkonema TaxID=1246629 RepID=UPI0035BA2F91
MQPKKQPSLASSRDAEDSIAYKQTPANRDLMYSREIILDYIRMRMCEEVFHLAIVEQIKGKLKEKFSSKLRSSNLKSDSAGDRPVDEVFDVEHEINVSDKGQNIVLFRIQVLLKKFPTQYTYVTINQIIDCIETFLSPCDRDDVWQPTIEDRIVYIKWDENAKPIPVLVLEQSDRVPFEQV